jgi:outer membrane biosynthesis protein TonB
MRVARSRKIDQGIVIGVVVAVIGHVALGGLLSLFEPELKRTPINPPMAVELIDESVVPPTAPKDEGAGAAAPAAASLVDPTPAPDPDPAPTQAPARTPESVPAPKLAPQQPAPEPKPVLTPKKPATIQHPIQHSIPKLTPKAAPRPIASVVNVVKPKRVQKVAQKGAGAAAAPKPLVPSKPVTAATSGTARSKGGRLGGLGGALAAQANQERGVGKPATKVATAGAPKLGPAKPPAAPAAPVRTKAQWEAKFIQDILAKIKPFWIAPTGADAELLKTQVEIKLNRDGTIASVRVIAQTGVTDSNQNLKGIHAERAIRAVRRAGSFTLPDELYDVWQTLGPITFDKRL